jgi:enamine deaminase RidA (YjgF/YER057c/UK114 family)
MNDIEQNLIKNKIKLPKATAPIANYNPFVITNNIVFISGQIPISEGNVLYMGKVGIDISIETAKKAAELCMLNSFAILKNAVQNNLLSIKKCIKINVFINSVDTFYEQPIVANGASDLITKIMGANSNHSRSAVSVNSLPKNAAVEIDSVFEISIDR